MLRVTVLALCSLAVLVSGWGGGQVNGPQPGQDYDEWLAYLTNMRTAAVKEFNITGAVLDVPELKWTHTNYMQPQTHPYDLRLWDYENQEWNVAGFLESLKEEYGGIDSILLWATYNVIGADDRNQFDMTRSLPGGVPGLQKVVQQFHDAGVHVLVPENPWDTGTRDEGKDFAHNMADFQVSLNTDGFNGDTMDQIPEEYYTAAVNLSHPIAIQPEGYGDNSTFNWVAMSWGEGWEYPFIPTVDFFQWLDPRHTTNICNRWAQNHTDDLQYAFFNAIGFETWQNVWGVYNQMTDRDAQATKIVGSVLRYLGAQGHVLSPTWTPHTPVHQHWTVFASRWPLGDDVAFTMVNRGSLDTSGAQIDVPTTGAESGAALRYFDLIHGVELTPASVDVEAGTATLAFDIEAFGYGAVLATPSAPADLPAFLDSMKALTASPLSSFSPDWHYTMQTLLHHAPTTPAATAPAGMVTIPAGPYQFYVSGVEIEGDDQQGVDYQFPWDLNPHRTHSQILYVDSFHIDTFPVTGQNYSDYLKATGYKPKDPSRWLQNWNGSASVPPSLANKPVTYVSYREAQAFCQWRGARLPEVWEWQYSVQTNDGRQYPWGNTNDQSKYPTQQHGRAIPGAEDVDAYAPQGCSPFGVCDAVGNVWQFTSEFMDAHTRTVIVRGSANYRPNGSKWYFPNALELAKQNKWFLMSDSYERCGTIGFRCVVDTPAPPPCSAAVCGRLNPPNAYTTLTGSREWAHWGWNNVVSPVRSVSAGSAPRVSDVTLVGDAYSVKAYANSPTAFSWSDGGSAGAKAVANTTTGIYTGGSAGSAGMQVTANLTALPPSDFPMAVEVNVGAYSATGKITVTTSGSGSTTWTDDNVTGYASSTMNAQYVLTVTAPTVVTIQWVLAEDLGGGNVTIQSVAVKEAAKEEV